MVAPNERPAASTPGSFLSARNLALNGIPSIFFQAPRRPLRHNRRSSLTGKCIWFVLRKYTAELGWPNVAPHDLRRTYAKLAYQGGAPLEQIQMSLGHASIQTTERYLGVKQDLADAPCDHLLRAHCEHWDGNGFSGCGMQQ
jgi:integrase